MFLSRIHLNLRCRDVRRDLADPYQLHSTLCRAFSTPDKKCAEGEFLWRLEPEIDARGPRIVVQSKVKPNWNGIGVQGWLGMVDPPIDLIDRLRLDSVKIGLRYRFRLRANPCVKRDGKRLGLLNCAEQQAWIVRKGFQHGFSITQPAILDSPRSLNEHIDVRISQEQMLRGRQHTGNAIRLYSVLYDGYLSITEPEKFRKALRTGIGHGKAMGLGLLSVASMLL